MEGKEPLALTVAPCDDEAPLLACEDMPRSKVVLDTEQLNFRVKSEDDFGVKQIGIEWEGADTTAITRPAAGEHIIAAGGFEKRSVEAVGTFSAQSLGIEPQPVLLRVYTEDYFPGRKRVYSPTSVLYVLNAEQHAIWMTEQLNKWHRQALEVRDRELQLHETNKQLRDLPPEQLDRPDVRRRIENQSAAERANGRRLAGLTATGEDLLRQAARNPQFDVGSLDRWAEMLQILKDIAANRMPSVADLLGEAAKARTAGGKPAATGPKAGQVRASGGKPSSGDPPGKTAERPPVPTVVNTESSLQPSGTGAASKAPAEKPSTPALRLPTTTLIGQAGANPPSPQSPAGNKMDEAVRRQQDLLVEFEKIVNELNNILANLEGSTLVKRLKAASREQYRVAGRVGDLLEGSFGKDAGQVGAPQKTVYLELCKLENTSSQKVSTIMDDLQAYFERRRFLKFKTVLDDMKSQDVVGGLRQIADELPGEPGLSIAGCEFWWDTMDRWAENLVDPACSGTCQCSGSPGSLPPAIVLEVLKILEGEVNLREETRVAEQARPALAEDQYRKRAGEQSLAQGGLEQRREGRDRADPRVAQRRGGVPAGNQAARRGCRGHGRREANPSSSRYGYGGDRAETRSDRTSLAIAPHNPRAGGGGGSDARGRRRRKHRVDSASGTVGDRRQRQGGARRGHGNASRRASGRSLPEEFHAGLDQSSASRLEDRESPSHAEDRNGLDIGCPKSGRVWSSATKTHHKMPETGGSSLHSTTPYGSKKRRTRRDLVAPMAEFELCCCAWG